MIDALRRFEVLARNSDWAVIYYAGHGLEVNRTNYLIPTDAKLISDKDVQDEAVSLERVESALEGTRKLRLVILDACRDNPFAARMTRSLGTRSTSGRGLASTEPESGLLVAYAARDGQTALDGTGENSPFVTALARRLSTPGLEINKLFRLVRDDVLTATGKRQEPYLYGSLPADDLYFNPVR